MDPKSDAKMENEAVKMENGEEKMEKATPQAETPSEESAPKAEAPADESAPKAETPSEESAPKAEETPAPEAAPETPDWKDRYARAMADFDNFRKRTARDREDLVKFAASDVIKDVLPTVDNLARAMEKANAEDPFVAGVKLVYDGLLKTLANHGATPLDSVGEPFDANFHEALAQMPSADVAEGIVMNEVKRGWLLNGKLLRAAQVVVSAGQPNA